MNKKSTLLAAALMAVSSLTVSAEDATKVEPKDYTEGNYYYLKTEEGKCLSLFDTKADSVVFKTIEEDAEKAVIDFALWEITKVGTETGGDAIYQFKNKKTKSILSFAKSEEAIPVLAEGVSQWSFKDGVIAAYWEDEKMILTAGSDKEGISFGGEGTKLNVVAPVSAYALRAEELGDNFSVFRLSFGGEFSGDIFSGKDLIATNVDGVESKSESTPKTHFVKLQIKGDEHFADGKPKYLGVDTNKTVISNATGVYGAKFIADSTYKALKDIHTVGNEDFQQFKFLVDLKNDSLAMFVYRAPKVNEEVLISSDDLVRVVYAQVGDNKVLTVTDLIKDGDLIKPTNGVAPFISVERGTPTEITGGTGVYFLKSASKGETAGKYIASYNKETNKIVTMTGTPSVNHPEGQWYIKEEGGMYSIVDRKDNTSLLLKGEVFAVQGMENTYTFGGSADSITVERQQVDFSNKFLGSVNFTKEDIANNGYALNLVPAGAETSDSYAMTADSILQVKSVDAKEAFVFKIEAVGEPEPVSGAKALGDTIFITNYKLKSQFSNKYVAYDNEKKSLKLSSIAEPFVFRFNTSVDGGKYNMEIVDLSDPVVYRYKYITADLSSSNMIIWDSPAYFNFVEMNAPEYGIFDSGNKRFTSDLKSLTMNPLNFFAEAKQEGQEILKSTYEKDNFSLWLSKSKASTAEKPLYFIMTSLAVDGVPGVDRDYFYMVSGRDSSLVDTSADKNYRVHFIKNDTIETMKDNANNPALFALKVTESGNYLLENQKELNSTEKSAPYVGIINNVVVMTKDGVEFSVETAPAPVANENIEAPTTVKVIGGVGEFSIRNAHGKKITVSNILGQTIATRIVSSDYVTVPTTRGVVIVSVEGDQAYKVIVK